MCTKKCRRREKGFLCATLGLKDREKKRRRKEAPGTAVHSVGSWWMPPSSPLLEEVCLLSTHAKRKARRERKPGKDTKKIGAGKKPDATPRLRLEMGLKKRRSQEKANNQRDTRVDDPERRGKEEEEKEKTMDYEGVRRRGEP